MFEIERRYGKDVVVDADGYIDEDRTLVLEGLREMGPEVIPEYTIPVYLQFLKNPISIMKLAQMFGMEEFFPGLKEALLEAQIKFEASKATERSGEQTSAFENSQTKVS